MTVGLDNKPYYHIILLSIKPPPFNNEEHGIMPGSTHKNLTDQTATAIQNIILDSGLEPGEQFAKEADLEKQLNVSRVVLREALSRLRAIGVVESRQGVGLIVSKPDPAILFEQAILRATDSQLTRLVELAEEFAVANAGKIKGRTLNDIEVEFHRTILEATHSRILMQMHSVLNIFFARAAEENPSYAADTTNEASVVEHREIAQAFYKRDVEQTRIALRSHLDTMFVEGIRKKRTEILE